MKFEISATDGAARRGQLHTAHGVINTPAFMTVGTAGTVKGLLPEQVKQTGAEIILGNTYHLMLRPGAERVARLGGLHKFMQWDDPILTDSGGFQVMSLAGLRKITEDGVNFQSHIDGSKHMLSPERSIEIQHLLDSDITMAFDECTPYPADHQTAAKSMQLSMRWAKRSLDAFKQREGYGIFGIVQGSVYEDLRTESAAILSAMNFDGLAIGGLAVGEGQAEMFRVLDFTASKLPTTKPRYLMGVGKPDDIIGAVMRGVDMFDCVIPTRSGRLARGYSHYGEMNIRNAKFADDGTPLDDLCQCQVCSRFSRAYLHHLFKAGEMLGPILLSWHNVSFYQQLMQNIRQAISENKLTEFAASFLSRYNK